MFELSETIYVQGRIIMIYWKKEEKREQSRNERVGYHTVHKIFETRRREGSLCFGDGIGNCANASWPAGIMSAEVCARQGLHTDNPPLRRLLPFRVLCAWDWSVPCGEGCHVSGVSLWYSQAWPSGASWNIGRYGYCPRYGFCPRYGYCPRYGFCPRYGYCPWWYKMFWFCCGAEWK